LARKKKEIEVQKTQEPFIQRDIYAKSLIAPIGLQTMGSTSSVSTTTTYTNETIKNLLKNPYSNYKKLQEVSNHFWATSSLYQNFLYYLATMMTFDNYPYPTFITPKKETMKERLMSSAETIKKSQIKEVGAIMLLRTLINGEAYWYDLSGDGQNTIFVEIPSDYCVLALIDDDNLWRYCVDLNKINSIIVAGLPLEIQNAYNEYKNNKDKNKKTKTVEDIEIPMNYHLVSKKGFAMFSHIQKAQHDYPFLSSMFADLNSYEENKDYYNQYIKSDNVKLIHLKIPVDKETGMPLMDADSIRAYHESAKEHMPANHAPLTNPFDVQGISVDKGQQAGINIVKHNSDVVHEGSGISKTLFDATTTNGLGYSIKADASKMYPFLYYFTNLLDYKLKKYRFRVQFLKINIYDQLDWHKQYAVDLTYGGLRSNFIATSGCDLYDFLKTAELEEMIDYDKFLPAKMNANQMSGKDKEKKSGNPGKDEDEKADGTVVGEGYE